MKNTHTHYKRQFYERIKHCLLIKLKENQFLIN